MKLSRSALMAGLLALGVAACGDNVELITPTPPVPPPPPPLVASMAPASAEVAVGSSVVFAVNASGGVLGEAASWSCSSSNTGIATASTTTSGCQATGVAGGGVTITATVTKGNETANVGSQLTVTAAPPPPPFEASIAPSSATVAVGSSIAFVVNTSGGYAGMMMDDMMMAASWECSSSDPAIATVTTTTSGCQATGVAGGDVTIVAVATDGHDTINLVAELAVAADPPPPPLSATMAPGAATVAVGSSAVFAINVSGGDPAAEASWICTSSDDGIATASDTGAGCQATGVAAGGVTINAVVTKGSETENVGAQLTVTADPIPAFVATMAPESAEIAVGSAAVFAINVSGGAADATASWDCTPSDAAIATVSTTDAGCEAMGVAAGGMTVNAVVTKGEDSANLVSNLTVTADPIPPFVATMAPESAEIAVDGSAVFAINVSGGDPAAEASWICTSSEVAVATAGNTDVGCEATGVAGGGVTIYAAVTKGEDSANLAAQLTVIAPDVGQPAFIVINTITDGDEDDSTLSGTVSVTINVERGDQSLEGLAVLLDGDVVASQSFGIAAAPAQDGAAEQAVHEFTLSFDTDGYDADGCPGLCERWTHDRGGTHDRGH